MAGIPLPPSPTSNSAVAAATSAALGEDALTAALKALDGQDSDLRVAIHALAAELRQSSQEVAGYIGKKRHRPHVSMRTC